jgi:hypothetical protein
MGLNRRQYSKLGRVLAEYLFIHHDKEQNRVNMEFLHRLPTTPAHRTTRLGVGDGVPVMAHGPDLPAAAEQLLVNFFMEFRLRQTQRREAICAADELRDAAVVLHHKLLSAEGRATALAREVQDCKADLQGQLRLAHERAEKAEKELRLVMADVQKISNLAAAWRPSKNG